MHDPAAVLRQVEGYRRVLAEYEEAVAYYTRHSREPAGEVTGLWSAVQAVAYGLGIDTEETTPNVDHDS